MSLWGRLQLTNFVKGTYIVNPDFLGRDFTKSGKVYKMYLTPCNKPGIGLESGRVYKVYLTP